MVDLVQTIAALGGTRVPGDCKGTSMVPWLDDPSHAWKDLAVSEYYAGYIASGIAMIRMGNWKYVYHTRADETHGPEVELYDLKADPGELRNLAKDPGQAKRLADMHKAWSARSARTRRRPRPGGGRARGRIHSRSPRSRRRNHNPDEPGAVIHTRPEVFAIRRNNAIARPRP